MIILMNENKSLCITKRNPIYKFETGVDSINILFPQKLGELELSELSCIALVKLPESDKGLYKYCTYEEELYKDRLVVKLPITSSLTKNAGNVQLWVVLLKRNAEDSSYADSVLESTSTSFEIVDNGSDFSSSEEKFDEIWEHSNSDEINKKLDDLYKKVDKLSDEKIDTVELNDENELIVKSGDKILGQVQLRDDVTWEEWK